MPNKKHHIAILCSGLDSKLRGYETHQQLLFRMLMADGYSVVLFKRDGAFKFGKEIPLNTPSEKSRIARFVARYYEDPNQVQKAFFAVAFVAFCAVFRQRYSCLMIIEPGVARIVNKLRRFLPGKPRIIYTHGVGDGPEYYTHYCDEIIEVNGPAFLKTKEFLMNKNIVKPVYCIPHFVDHPIIDSFQIEEAQLQELKSYFGLNTKYIALHVGLICEDPKNIQYIIEEVEGLSDDWSLFLVGEVQDTHLIQLAKEKLGPRFSYTSLPRDKVWQAYAVSDFMVFASINEGFGLVIIESMLFNLPFLLPDIPLYRWITDSSESNLYTLKPGELSHKLESSIEEREALERHVFKTKELLHRRYTWEAVKSQYFETFQKQPE